MVPALALVVVAERAAVVNVESVENVHLVLLETRITMEADAVAIVVVVDEGVDVEADAAVVDVEIAAAIITMAIMMTVPLVNHVNVPLPRLNPPPMVWRAMIKTRHPPSRVHHYSSVICRGKPDGRN
jgi:hypothetical protein